MITEVFVLFYIFAVYIAIAFWEANMEGEFGWAARQCGWCIDFKIWKLTAYHFWLWIVMVPLFLALPFVIFGFHNKMFGIVLAGYFFGAIVEDFTWFFVNPKVPFTKFNSKYVTWYPWIKFKNFEVPTFYVLYLLIGSIVWITLV
ncbi:MAG: hypothetical protein V1660_00675 [archaeon]